MFIRYFCHVTPKEGKEGSLGDLGFSFFAAFAESGADIRVIPINISDFTAGSRWAEHGEAFTREVPKQYINVVCGNSDELKRMYTLGVKNIAIVDSFECDKEVLDLYSFVFFPGIDSQINASFLKGFL